MAGNHVDAGVLDHPCLVIRRHDVNIRVSCSVSLLILGEDVVVSVGVLNEDGVDEGLFPTGLESVLILGNRDCAVKVDIDVFADAGFGRVRKVLVSRNLVPAPADSVLSKLGDFSDFVIRALASVRTCLDHT